MNARCLLAASLLILAFSVHAAPDKKPTEPVKAGATIVGDNEAAIGLYLTPWKDEEPLPPGRNPSNFTIEAAPADVMADRARIDALDSIDSHRRASRQAYGH